MQGGKSTVANFLENHHGYIRLKFAQVLKDMLAVFLTNFVNDPWVYLEGDKKEEVVPGLNVTGRHLMQTLGTNWARHHIGLDTWIIATLNKLDSDRHYVIDDMRFPNEYEALTKKGFITIRLVGYGEITSQHESESQLDNFPFDYVIYNDSTIEELLTKINVIINELS